MKIGPLFKWFGSKWLSSRLYPPPEHDDIFEPFAGSAGYSLRHHEKKIHIWESNDQLLELWRWIIEIAAMTYDQPFRPGGPEGERETVFACGRQFVGQQIVKQMRLVAENPKA